MSGGIQHFMINNKELNLYDDGQGLSVGRDIVGILLDVDGLCLVVFIILC